MQLYQFQAQVGGSDAYAIRARQLDENFARLQPQTDGTYSINEGPNGWTLKIFPEYPQTIQGAGVLSFVNGGLQWVKAQELKTTAQDVLDSFDTNGRGPLDLREVERCDGKRMLVLGTEWYDP